MRRRSFIVVPLVLCAGVMYLYSRELSVRGVTLTREPQQSPPAIPHIIHQIWDSPHIPEDLADWVKSWKRHNPTWAYVLWTPDDVRALLRERYPEYLTLYDSYHFTIFRSDAARYFLMDTYGGFYADLDVECFKQLDPWTVGHKCLLSHEPYVHPSVLFNRSSPNVMTTIFACRPGHPFFKQVIRALPDSFARYPMDVLESTGPFFLDRVFRDYNRSGLASMVVGPDSGTPTHLDSVSVVGPDVFLPTFDPHQPDSLRDKCTKFLSRPEMNAMATRQCTELVRTNFSNTVSPESYTNHHWVHIFLNRPLWDKQPAVNITDLVPDAKSYGRNI